jgi:hypothetical protein
MQCQFKVVVGQGKYDVDTYSTSVTSRSSAAEEVKKYLEDNNIKSLGFFITALFERDPRSKRVNVIWAIKDEDIDKAVREIQTRRPKRPSNWLIRKKPKRA